MVAALVPFSTTDFINIRALGVGIGVAVLLDVLIMRPVLLPAAETVLGRTGCWPTHGPRRPARETGGPGAPPPARHRLHRPHPRRHHPGPAH